MDYYSVLGIDKTASAEDIKSAYRRKAKEFHPDSGSGDPKKFDEVTQAYKVLNDPQARKQYDTFGSTSAERGPSFEDIFASFFDGGFNFSGFGGQRSQRGQRHQRRGRSIKEVVEVTLEEAARGVKKQIKNQYLSYCRSCSGAGGSLSSCNMCNGTGAKTQRFGNTTIQSPCDQCRGLGKTISQTCDKCKGSGERYEYENLSIDIPPGVFAGSEFRINGHGCEDEAGIPRGDLHLQVEILPHKTFSRKNDDLVMEIELSMVDACLGTSKNITSIYGEHIDIKIPAGIQPGKTLKIPNQGMPSSTGKGNLYVIAKVKIPEKIPNKWKKILQELEKEVV